MSALQRRIATVSDMTANLIAELRELDRLREQVREALLSVRKSQQPKRRNGVLSTLNVTIETLNLAKEISSITPAKAVFGSVSVLLTMIKVSFLPRRPASG